MTDHITLHRQAIKGIGQTITELKTVFDLAPEKLDSAELPALYPLTSQASYSESIKGEDFLEVTRVYRVQVPVIPIGLANPQDRENMCQPLIESVVSIFQGYPTSGIALLYARMALVFYPTVVLSYFQNGVRNTSALKYVYKSSMIISVSLQTENKEKQNDSK